MYIPNLHKKCCDSICKSENSMDIDVDFITTTFHTQKDKVSNSQSNCSKVWPEAGKM